MGLVPDGYDGRFRYVGTVLERAPGGPHLCGAVVALSYPPQCSGPDVVGWTWAGLGAASFNRTTWGEYELVGTWDGRFHLTEPATVAGAETRPTSVHEVDQDLTTPCPGPAGGWRPVDMARTTEDRVEETARLAATLPGFGGFWIDQPVGNRDPARMVLNARFTERLAERESELRRVWGGALCVSRAPRTKAELDRVQQALRGLPDLVMTGQEVATSVVTALVYVATEQAQRGLDRRFGAGVVRLSGLLEPVDL